MNTDELTDSMDRMRCDLSATWLAIAAMQTVLTPAQRESVLTAMAKASAQKQAMYDAPQPNAEMQVKLAQAKVQMQQAEDRVFALLQAAPNVFGPG